jgi:hypothetical protein
LRRKNNVHRHRNALFFLNRTKRIQAKGMSIQAFRQSLFGCLFIVLDDGLYKKAFLWIWGIIKKATLCALHDSVAQR